MKKINKNKEKRLLNFMQELSWVFDSFKDVNFKDAYEYFQQQDTVTTEHGLSDDTQYLVGVLPKLFQDKDLFPNKEDIIEFSEVVLDLHLSRAAKRSKIEYIGMIVCEVSNSNSKQLNRLVEALEKIVGNENQMQAVKSARKEPDFSWNETIAKLGKL
ncbi:hypothetical protein [Phocaeicola sp.]